MKKNAWLALMTAMMVVGGCGYSSRRPFPTHVRTICVKPFASRVFRRRIEMDLTRAIKKRIQMDTPYRLADEKHADTVLTGEVLNIKQATMGRDFRFNMPRETQLTMVVRFQWKDLRNGVILVDRPHWLQTFDYARPVRETEWTALQGAVDRMAETIVEQMEVDW